jgi:hypothetical protein
MSDNYASLDKRLALLEQKLDTIEHNHLKHLQDDLTTIKKWFGWGIGVIFVQLLAVIASMMM